MPRIRTRQPCTRSVMAFPLFTSLLKLVQIGSWLLDYSSELALAMQFHMWYWHSDGTEVSWLLKRFAPLVFVQSGKTTITGRTEAGAMVYCGAVSPEHEDWAEDKFALSVRRLVQSPEWRPLFELCLSGYEASDPSSHPYLNPLFSLAPPPEPARPQSLPARSTPVPDAGPSRQSVAPG